MLNRSGADIAPRAAGFNGGCTTTPAEDVPSLGGSGLFRKSLSVVLEDEGVTAGDCPAPCELDCEGEDVPSFDDSPFLDFVLFGSFERESCSC